MSQRRERLLFRPRRHRQDSGSPLHPEGTAEAVQPPVCGMPRGRREPGQPAHHEAGCSRGVASLLCGGQTLHHMAGCGVPTSVHDMKRCWETANRLKWWRMDVLVIDEVSMLQASLLDWLDVTMRQLRGQPLIRRHPAHLRRRLLPAPCRT
mmetsp:Transcript_17222/g.41257  ORF Transcript_17222/g.41257 Transcript_17222/m.41257 type:complete len:151 (+) Transcript_17222:583-1035(+)